MADEERFILKGSDVRFGRSGDGQVLLKKGGKILLVSNLMAASPITDPNRMVSVRDENGAEIGILDDVRQLDPASQKIVAEELDRSYFMPRITDVIDITEDLGVETWAVETDKGPRVFQVRNPRQNVRRITRRRLVIKDVDGNRYEIHNYTELPASAERLLRDYM